MEISDLIITKPGGLTVTEAFAKNIPMIIPFLIPGQEEENAEMLVKIGAAIRAEGPKAISMYIEKFIKEPLLIELMKQNMQTVSIDHSLDDAVGLCLSLMTYKDDVGIKYAE
jgi:processive 1,2-diacylglycerol beta-glucosyltransferase